MVEWLETSTGVDCGRFVASSWTTTSLPVSGTGPPTGRPLVSLQEQHATHSPARPSLVVQVLESKSAWRPNFGSLKHGIWNNSWKNWGKIAAVFLVVYGIEAGYFAGLLYSSQYIRQQTYRALPTQYFGEFIRTANVYTVR